MKARTGSRGRAKSAAPRAAEGPPPVTTADRTGYDDPIYRSTPSSAAAARTMPGPLRGSLPLDLRTSDQGAALVPAALFAPAHLRPTNDPYPGPSSPPRPGRALVLRQAATAVATTPETTTAEATLVEVPPADLPLIEQTASMLTDGQSAELTTRFRANPDDASFDFNEYVFLRNPDDPFARGLTVGPGTTEIIPSDPRFARFVREAGKGIAAFVEYVSLSVWLTVPAHLLTERRNSLLMILPAWWFDVCAIRAFNRLGRYSRSDIKQLFNYGFSPEAFYADSLSNWLGSTTYAEVQQFLATGDATVSGPLSRLLTVPYWEEVLGGVFAQYFDANGIGIVDPSAPEGEYPFDPFPADEVLFGLRVVHRQTWHLLGYARGELIKTIPLGPRETQKISVRVTRRKKFLQTQETVSSFETTSEVSDTAKNTSEVVREASRKFNLHGEAEAGVDVFTLVKAKVSAGFALDTATSTKGTTTSLNEMMVKASNRMKHETKVTVSVENEETFEEARSSEITNPNDELAVTYLYHRLQQRYWVSTGIGEVCSVVFVPEPLPAWDDVTEAWVRAHGDVVAAALLDPGFASVLAAIRNEPDNLSHVPTAVFEGAANASIAAVGAYRTYTGGRLPDMLASGQQCFERDYERRDNLAMDQARRRHQSAALLTHIRRNLLHYMRAIWASEDHDQRMQRLSRIRVPVSWTFVPSAPLPAGAPPASPLEVEGVFMPDSGSARPLTDVIDPIGPIGFLFNCAVYRLRDDPKLVNLHQALSYIRSAYTRFAVAVSVSAGAGVTVRQAVAVSPRSFSADYTFTYRTNRGKWLIPVPGRSEGDWIEVRVLSDGSLEALGLRIWLDGAPANQAELTVRVRATADLEDPHLRLVQMLHPLPRAAEEGQVFTERLLAEMVTVFPDLAPGGTGPLSWAALTEAQRALFRSRYHVFLMLRESGRLVTLDTANVVLDLEISTTPALEPFKRLHRYLDVKKAYEELRRIQMDNARRAGLLVKGSLGDPDIENVTLVGARDDLKDVIAVAGTPD